MLELRGAPTPDEPADDGSQDQFRAVLGQLAAGAYTCAADGRITFFNHAAVDVWGRVPRLNDPGDLYCGSYRLFAIDGTPITHDQCWMALALRDRSAYHGRPIRIERPDGSRLEAVAFASPLCDADGNLLGGVNILVHAPKPQAHDSGPATIEHERAQQLVGLACEIRAQLDPLRRTAQALSAMPAASNVHEAVDVIDRQLRQITQLVDRLLNFEFDAPAQ